MKIDRPKLTADEWQLYTSKPNAARVARSLNAAALRTFKAIEKALAPSPHVLPREQVMGAIREAYNAHLGAAMRSFSEYGADDTEPQEVAADLLAGFAVRYGVHEVSRWEL